MGCDPKKFDDVTPGVFEGLKVKMAAQGLPITDSQGTINGPMGLEVDYVWNEGNAALVIQVVKKPMLVSCSMIYDQVEKAIKEVRTA